MAGGLLFATGAVVLYMRKGEVWADFPVLLVLLIPAGLLYGLGIGREEGASAPARWQSAFLVYGVVLVPLALAQLVEVLGGDPDKAGNVAWIFLATATLAGFAAFARGAVYQALLMAVALVVAWVAFWDAVLGDPSLDAFRWLLVLLAAGFVAGAVALRTASPDMTQPVELITGAGLAAVAAGGLTLVDVVVQLFSIFFAEEGGIDDSSLFWEAFLLAASLALIAFAAREGARGPAYVGALGLAAFALLAGIDISGLVSEGVVEGDLVGWPLVLLVAGAGVLLAGMLPRRPGASRSE